MKLMELPDGRDTYRNGYMKALAAVRDGVGKLPFDFRAGGLVVLREDVLALLEKLSGGEVHANTPRRKVEGNQDGSSAEMQCPHKEGDYKPKALRNGTPKPEKETWLCFDTNKRGRCKHIKCKNTSKLIDILRDGKKNGAK